MCHSIVSQLSGTLPRLRLIPLSSLGLVCRAFATSYAVERSNYLVVPPSQTVSVRDTITWTNLGQDSYQCYGLTSR